MRVVIDIPEEVYNHATNESEDSHDEVIAIKAIANGVVLPEHHGRLGDMDKLIIEVMDRGIDHIQTNDFAELCQIIDEAPCLLEPYVDMGGVIK